MSDTKDHQDKFERFKFFMEYYGRYHDDKETMAWVATAFYLAGAMYLSFIVRELACDCWWAQMLFTMFFVFGGYLVFCFVKWQFDRRWEAHEKVLDFAHELCSLVIGTEKQKEKDRPKRGCRQSWKASKYLLPCFLCEKEGRRLDKELQPIKSELVTYIAIASVAIVVILLLWIHNA